MHLTLYFFFQAEDGIRDTSVTGVQTCALPISRVFDGPAFTQARSKSWSYPRIRGGRPPPPHGRGPRSRARTTGRNEVARPVRYGRDASPLGDSRGPVRDGVEDDGLGGHVNRLNRRRDIRGPRDAPRASV